MKRRSDQPLFRIPFTMLGILFCLSALCWLLYYLLLFNPFFKGIFFAFLLAASQLYVIWRMVRQGEVRAHGATRRRRRLLPFFYGKRPKRIARTPISFKDKRFNRVPS